MLDKRTYDRTCHYQTFYRCQWYVHQQIECTANLTISFDSPTSIHSPSEFAVSVALLTSCILVFRVFLDSSLKNCRFLQQWGSRGSISALWTSRWSIPALPRCCERRIHIETVIDSQFCLAENTRKTSLVVTCKSRWPTPIAAGRYWICLLTLYCNRYCNQTK